MQTTGVFPLVSEANSSKGKDKCVSQPEGAFYFCLKNSLFLVFFLYFSTLITHF